MIRHKEGKRFYRGGNTINSITISLPWSETKPAIFAKEARMPVSPVASAHRVKYIYLEKSPRFRFMLTQQGTKSPGNNNCPGRGEGSAGL